MINYMIRGIAVLCLPLAMLAWNVEKPLVAGVFILTTFFAGAVDLLWVSKVKGEDHNG